MTTQAAPPAATVPPQRRDAWSLDVLSHVWHQLDAPLVVLDADREVRVANDAAHPHLDAVRAALEGRSPSPFGAGAVSPVRLPSAVEGALAGNAVRWETTVARPDADPRRYAASALPFTGPDGRPAVLVSWHDVTDLRREEVDRATDLMRLNRLVDGAADYAIFMLDPHGDVQTWSSSAERVKRFRREDVVGQPYARFFLPEDRAAELPGRILEEARRTGRAETTGLRLRGDGTSFWARGVVTAEHDRHGRLIGFVKVTHDVTEEHRTRQEVLLLNQQLLASNARLEQAIAERTAELRQKAVELEAANAELEAFSYSVSHDLRAPLRAMSGFARAVVEDHAADLGPDGLRHLERIQASAGRMGELIEGLLAFARVQRRLVAEEPVDMTSLAAEAWAQVCPEDDVALHLPALPGRRGDRALLRQIWVNLLGNAVKFTRGGPEPRVEVGCSTARGVDVYSVADNGAGFDMAHADQLFTPFERLHRAEDFPGTGIGLALVHRIVRRHGGGIEADAAPGQGAVFRFWLDPLR